MRSERGTNLRQTRTTHELQSACAGQYHRLALGPIHSSGSHGLHRTPLQCARRALERGIALAFLVLPAVAFALDGLVVKIQDGDTLTVLVAQQQIKVRIASIDAPELEQPFGQRSRQSLADICHQKQASVAPAGHDRYGRTIGEVVCDGVPAGSEQVRRGMAWVYVRFATAGSTLYQLEAEARIAQRGLWSATSPTPPWGYRRK